MASVSPPSSSGDIARLSAALTTLEPYVFSALDALKQDARARGVRFTDLGIGSPDRPTPVAIVEAMQRAAADPSTHGYPPFRGVPRFLESAATFMDRRFGVSVDPGTEIIALAGAKEGIAHLVAAITGPDDVILVPDIHYPVYVRAPHLSGASVHLVPMRASTGFLADFESVPRTVCARARLLIINYPNNPTGAVAEREYFERAVAFAHEHGLVLVSDLAYSQLTYDGFIAPSVLEVPGAREVAIEFHSCSKSFNMAGPRVGFAVGNRALIDALDAYRTNVGYGAPSIVQHAAAHAFDHFAELSAPVADGYRERRDAVVAAMARSGREATPARGAMYLWQSLPAAVDDWTFTRAMLDDAQVVVTPGSAFGPGGAGYFRLSYVAEPAVLTAAVDRLAAAAARRGWR